MTKPSPIDSFPKPIKWLAPTELVRALFRLIVSKMFGEYADKREIVGLKANGTKHRIEGDEPIFDFVADTGDGFHATCTVASAIAGQTPQADALLHGGDLVYPTANAAEYDKRFRSVYNRLQLRDPTKMKFFAIPGNHDWYDGLQSFVRLFCSQGNLSKIPMEQTRSYWAITMPKTRWAIWGLDVQFDGLIDADQISYFRQAGEELENEADDKTGPWGIVLVTAKPSWLKAFADGSGDPCPVMNNIEYLAARCVPESAKIRMIVSGDVHNYSRYAEPEPTPTADETRLVKDALRRTQYVVAGGGGAYLSPTHHLPEKISFHPRPFKNGDPFARDEPRSRCDLERQKINPLHTRGYTWRFLLVGLKNASLPLVLAGLYLLVRWVYLGADALQFGARPDSLDVINEIQRSSLSPARWFTIGLFSLALAASLAFFAGIQREVRGGLLRRRTWGTKNNLKAVVLGSGHAAAHLAAAVATPGVVSLTDWQPAWYWRWLTVLGIAMVVATTIFSLYLFIADRFGHNSNELFAGLQIQDHNNFMRMRFGKHAVICTPISVPRTKKWAWNGSAERWDPVDGRPPATAVIETFAVARLPNGAPTALKAVVDRAQRGHR